jgi:hypothetical protein
VLGVCHVKKIPNNDVCVEEEFEMCITIKEASIDLWSVFDNIMLKRAFNNFRIEMCGIAMGMENLHAIVLLQRDFKTSNIFLH